MGRRDPSYRIMNHLMNFALDIAEKKIEQKLQKPAEQKYLPAVRGQEVVSNDIANLIKVDRPDVYFDRDIGGLREAKEELRKLVIYPITMSGLYSLYEKRLGNILLYGPYGCGKTSLVKAVANECGWPFIHLQAGDIIKNKIGDREKAAPTIFGYCRSLHTNSILYMDECEQFFLRNGPPYVQRIKNSFEEEMDGIKTKKGFPIMIAATKKPWLVEPAMRRPGRFKTLIIPPPNLYERKEILRLGLNKFFYKNMVEGDYEMLLSDLADRTESFSGADIINSLIEDAVDIPLSEARTVGIIRKIRKSDFEEVLKKKKPSTTSWFSEAIRACKRYDENDLLEEIMKYYPNGN